MSKRPGSDYETDESPPRCLPKRRTFDFETVQIGSVSTLEEMDIKVLRFQNSKLKQRFEVRQKFVFELKERIMQLEQRQNQDDLVLSIVNRHWNQLDEDIQILLQRFDIETEPFDEAETKNEMDATQSFLAQLSTWDKEELELTLSFRVLESKTAVAKIIQAFDRLKQRNEQLVKLLKGGSDAESTSGQNAIQEMYIQNQQENKKLHTLTTTLHANAHTQGLKMKELNDKLTASETKGDELRNQVDDLTWEVSKLTSTNDKLVNHIDELSEKFRTMQSMSKTEEKEENILTSNKNEVVRDSDYLYLQHQLEELKESNINKLRELEQQHNAYTEATGELENMKILFHNLPLSFIKESDAYKSLLSKYAYIYNDNLELRKIISDGRNKFFSLKSQLFNHMEKMEQDQQKMQINMGKEMEKLEDSAFKVKKEYEMLRIEFEQNLAENEQTSPTNREMSQLISSLQNQNQQLKFGADRYKRKYKDINIETQQLKRQKEYLEKKLTAALEKDCGTCGSSFFDGGGCKEGENSTSSFEPSPNLTPSKSPIASKNEENKSEGKNLVYELFESDHVQSLKELKAQLKKAVNENREMKLLIDMYKTVGKDKRDKAQIMVSEKKVRVELEELKTVVKKLQEKKEVKKLAEEDAIKKIKYLEEQVHSLQRKVASQKQEEDTLLTDMEVTGQAFDDMQEQNSRLIQQLQEKDASNFKLISDRIKTHQMQNLAREETNLLREQIGTLKKRIEAQDKVVKTLEEKEKLLESVIPDHEKESLILRAVNDINKEKSHETADFEEDIRLHLEKSHALFVDAQKTIKEKNAALQAEAFELRRLQEELEIYKNKIKRQSQIETSKNPDEVLQEEVKEYKEMLQCPSCKVNRKDAVLTKCFHLFCFDCLRTRYETRERKCPKCNASFGAKDYHRLYLT